MSKCSGCRWIAPHDGIVDCGSPSCPRDKTPAKELEPRQWKEGEEAEWIADKVCALGDYGQDAARVLRRQVEELADLRSQVVELQEQLDEAARQEPVGEIVTEPFGDNDICALKWAEHYDPAQGDKLYAEPVNLPALIEQAKVEEAERLMFVLDNDATQEEVRADFEAAHPELDLVRNPAGNYASARAEFKWQGWQACVDSCVHAFMAEARKEERRRVLEEFKRRLSENDESINWNIEDMLSELRTPATKRQPCTCDGRCDGFCLKQERWPA